MEVVKAFKYQLKTNKAIELKLGDFAGAVRFVWNKMLSLNITRLEKKELIMYYQEMNFWINLYKKSEEHHFLKNCHSQLIQQKLKDLEKAFKDCFDKKQINKKFPRFKKKDLDNSFRYPQGVKINDDLVFLPKIGWIKFRKSREIIGNLKNTTISKKSNKWYISFQTEYEIVEPQRNLAKEEIAIDLGIKSFVTLSDGKYINGKSSFRKSEKKLQRQQRILSRKKKHSNNFKKQKQKIGKIHNKITNIRNDFLHKVSTDLTKKYNVIYLEDLKIKNMSKSSKGTIENPGSNIKRKSGLNKSILDQGWGNFANMLEYKLKWNGGQLIKVNPKYTSQTCSKCGNTERNNRESQSIFKCKKCHYEQNADLNAALNILAAGQTVLACGDIRQIAV